MRCLMGLVYDFLKDFASPIVTIGLAFYINKKVIPRYQNEAQLKKDIFNFHEKYMKVADRLCKARLDLTSEFELTKRHHHKLIPLESTESIQKNLNIDGFKTFSAQRKNFYKSRIEYMACIMALINLYFEELRYVVSDYPMAISSHSQQKMYKTFYKWLDLTVSELIYHIEFLDTVTIKNENNNIYSQKFAKLNFKNNLNILENLGQISLLELEKRNDNIKIQIPDYKEASKLFDVDYTSNKIINTLLDPFWISEKDYFNLTKKIS